MTQDILCVLGFVTIAIFVAAMVKAWITISGDDGGE